LQFFLPDGCQVVTWECGFNVSLSWLGRISSWNRRDFVFTPWRDVQKSYIICLGDAQGWDLQAEWMFRVFSGPNNLHQGDM